MDMPASMPAARNTTLEEMLTCVARFAELRGSEEAFVDSRLPGCRRRKINLIGSGVVVNVNDLLWPKRAPLVARMVGLMATEYVEPARARPVEFHLMIFGFAASSVATPDWPVSWPGSATGPTAAPRFGSRRVLRCWPSSPPTGVPRCIR